MTSLPVLDIPRKQFSDMVGINVLWLDCRYLNP